MFDLANKAQMVEESELYSVPCVFWHWCRVRQGLMCRPIWFQNEEGGVVIVRRHAVSVAVGKADSKEQVS